MLEKGVRRSINAEHADLLEPIIRKSISDALGRDRNRMANLLIRSTAQVSQIRYLLINLLGRAGSPRKVTAEQLNKILDWSRKQAREDIIRRSPATEELIKAVSAWMDGDGGSEEETAT